MMVGKVQTQSAEAAQVKRANDVGESGEGRERVIFTRLPTKGKRKEG